MKKIVLTIITLAFAITGMAQTQPDAEYNLIRRSYKVNKDGSMDIRYRKEIKLLRNRAITAYADKGETFISYNPSFETLTINECYTIMADGTKVVTPQNAFVLQLPAECTDCGRLNDIREMAIVHTALEYNCTIVLDYTLHRNSSLLVERFNLNQDCPVKRYEIRYADGHTQIENNLPQTVNDPYMPARQGYDVEFQLGEKPIYTAEKELPAARTLLANLKKSNSKEYIAAIRDWVVDYVHLNPVDPARTNYTMTPAHDVFSSNCGTAIDKTGLLAALLGEAGFQATIVDGSINVFGDRPLEVEVTLEGKAYRLSASKKTPLMTEAEKADAANVAAAPIYKESKLEWAPEALADGYVRITLPNEVEGLHIDPALLAPSRTSDLQASLRPEYYHYTMELPKGATLIGGNIEIEYTNSVGSIQIVVKQKKNRLLVTRSLRLRKAVITKADYSSFRQLMIDWNGHKELIFSL
ncbi:MAG: DUF3857 domain-containing protein [Bacteroidales bacterium]|nr:DUF3857 domain-containing protein [Bacteroidales bacterium]